MAAAVGSGSQFLVTFDILPPIHWKSELDRWLVGAVAHRLTGELTSNPKPGESILFSKLYIFIFNKVLLKNALLAAISVVCKVFCIRRANLNAQNKVK